MRGTAWTTGLTERAPMRKRKLGTLLGVAALIGSSLVLVPITNSYADGAWNVSPLAIDFGTTTWEPGRTPPPRLSFTITNTDPQKYLLVDIQETTESRTTSMDFERNPSNSTATCATIIYSNSSCTQNIIFSPVNRGTFNAVFVVSGRLQGGSVTTETVTATGTASKLGVVASSKPSALPKPNNTKTPTAVADLVVGFRDPLVVFENGLFSKKVRITQFVVIKNRGPKASDGGTIVFHYPENAVGPAEPTGNAVTGCSIKHIAEERFAGYLTFEQAACTLEPIAVGQTVDFSVTYDIGWAHLMTTATTYISGKEDPSPDTSAQGIETELVNPFRPSRQLKLSVDYKLHGSSSRNNPAMK